MSMFASCLLTAFCAVVAFAVRVSNRVFAAARSASLVARLLTTPALSVFSPARSFLNPASCVSSGVIWLTSVVRWPCRVVSSTWAALMAASNVARSSVILVSCISAAAIWPSSLAFAASMSAICFSAAAICAERVFCSVTSAARSVCSLAISSAFCRAAAFSRFGCTMPRCASWFVTPLQMPVVGDVSALAALPVPNRLPATMTGMRNARVARPGHFLLMNLEARMERLLDLGGAAFWERGRVRSLDRRLRTCQ